MPVFLGWMPPFGFAAGKRAVLSVDFKVLQSLERSVAHFTHIRPKRAERSSEDKEFGDTVLEDVSRAIQTKDGRLL